MKITLETDSTKKEIYEKVVYISRPFRLTVTKVESPSPFDWISRDVFFAQTFQTRCLDSTGSTESRLENRRKAG